MRAVLALMVLTPSLSLGFSLKESTIKSKAYMIPTPGGIYEALDLRGKKFTFNEKDFEDCGNQIQRKPKSLSFTCTVTLNPRNEPSILKLQLSQPLVRVPFGGVQKNVTIDVSKDGRFVTFSTRLDDTGVDHSVVQFNDEFFAIQSKVAQLIFKEAMTLQTLDIRVLETPKMESPRPAGGRRIRRAFDARL